MADPLHLTDQDVVVVLRAISEGRVRTVRGDPYDPALWNEEAVRDWLERTHQPRRARQILAELAHGDIVRSRAMAPTVEIMLQSVLSRIDQLEREVAALKANAPRPESPPQVASRRRSKERGEKLAGITARQLLLSGGSLSPPDLAG